MFPTVVPVQAEVDLHERPPFRPLGFADQMQPGLLRRAVGLLRVALDAGADNVFPRRRATAVPWQNVIQIQILAVESAPAVLAGVFVALENVVARELDFLLGQPVVDQQQDDTRHTDPERNGMNGFLAWRGLGKVPPFLKVERAERTVTVAQHGLGVTLEQQGQGAPGGADVDRLPQPVQHKHMLVQRGVHGTGWGHANKTGGAGQPPLASGRALISSWWMRCCTGARRKDRG